jgi:vitamin B12 transporter
VTAGLTFNEFSGHDNTFTNQYLSDWAGYLQDEWEVVKNLNLTAGARDDSYELAGEALTYRFTGSYLFPRTHTKIRSSYGTAFQAPSIYELYSNSTFAKGSPGLKPEKSRGWDIGVDQYLLDRHITLSATYFQNNIRDLIDFVSTSQVTGYYQNRDTAENDGVELAAQLTLYREWRSRISYTYTDSTYTDLGVTQRRDEIPRNHLNLDTSYVFGKLLLGAGVSFVGGRVDTDYSTTPTTQVNLGDYWTARIYSRYTFNDHFAIFARIENMTGSHYEDVLGYPALPIGVYGGINIRF